MVFEVLSMKFKKWFGVPVGKILPISPKQKYKMEFPCSVASGIITNYETSGGVSF